MSSKLDIKRGSKNFSITINMVIITVLGIIITAPARATSLKNDSFEQQVKALYNQNIDATPNYGLLKQPLNSQALSSKKNKLDPNDIKYSLFEETRNTINQLKQASLVRQETILNKQVYLYYLETKDVDTSSNNRNIWGAYESRWKLPAPAPRRKVSEPATGVALLFTLTFFAKLRQLK